MKDNHIDIKPEHLEIVKAILQEHIPGKIVWVYGSRVTGKSKSQSDLDIVVFDAGTKEINELKDAFAESDLPFSVDVMDWGKIPEKFKENIREKYVVLQEKMGLGEWRECRLGDLIKENIADLQTGPFGTMLKASEYTSNGTPMIAVQDIGENKLHPEKLNYLPESVAERLSRYKVKVNDIIFGRKGAVDRRAIITKNEDGWIQGSDCIRLRLNDDNDSRFISYQLGNSRIKDWLHQHSHGATMPSLNQEILSLLPLTLPSLTEQRAITSVLSSLDDKIDLLHRQNKTLEAMAETLFRQWFGPPGPLKGEGISKSGYRVAKSPLGDLGAEEWKEVRLSDIAEHKKINVKPNDNHDILYHHYSIPAFDIKHQPVVEAGSEIQSNKFKVLPNTILISKLNPRFPRVWAIPQNIDENSICSTEFQVVSPIIKEWYGFIYCLLKSKQVEDELVGAAGGTSGSHQRVKPEDIFNLTFLQPDMKTLKRFNELTSNYWPKIQMNYQQIMALEKMREMLLPKLMSGEVRVEV